MNVVTRKLILNPTVLCNNVQLIDTQLDAILASIATRLLLCILGHKIWWEWVTKMSERNCEVLVYRE